MSNKAASRATQTRQPDRWVARLDDKKMRCAWTALLSALLLMPGAGHFVTAAQPSADSPADTEEIAALIRDLGDTSYERRTRATRRLCSIGMPAYASLRRAAEGDNVEVALRAKHLLTVMDKRYFAGAEVSLAFSAATIHWDDPVDLIVTITNPTAYEVRVPFELDEPRRGTTTDAEQVGAMLDVADFLLVIDPKGKPVEPRVDDIMADPAVQAAVEDRVEHGFVGVISPGGKAVLRVPAFNRGWARYPFLDPGRYSVTFAYAPPWEDDVLREAGVGRIVSNTASVRVQRGAPDAVSRRAQVASVEVAASEGFLIASVTNRSDQRLVVNRNFGPSAPFATAAWVVTAGALMHERPVHENLRPSLQAFDAERLVNLPPGKSLELTRIEIKRLRNWLGAAGADIEADKWSVHFSYGNVCDRGWQSRHEEALHENEETPAVLQERLSRHMLSARLASSAMKLPHVRSRDPDANP